MAFLCLSRYLICQILRCACGRATIGDMAFSPDRQSGLQKQRDLPRDLEEYRKEFGAGLEAMAKSVNTDLAHKLLTGTGAVRMEGFYPKEILADDRQKMETKKTSWIQKHFSTAEVSDEQREQWEKMEAAKPRKGELLEMVVTVLLHKVLKDRYVIARASKFDDYFGFDNIIVNKETGAVVCTFDDVHDQAYGDTVQEKIHEMKKSAQKGGARIKYGFTFENGELVKKEIDHVPKLYNPFSVSELDDALRVVNPKDLDAVSAEEQVIYNRIIDKFAELIPQLQASAQGDEYKKNLADFAAVLPSLKR